MDARTDDPAALTTVTPPLRHLGFRVRVPQDWRELPLPAEEHDFTDPNVFAPAGVFMASYEAIVFAVAARPAYADGSLEEWLRYSAAQQRFELDSVEPATLGALKAAACDARQETDVGPMRLRVALFEDGGRLFTLTAMAPEALWSSVRETFAGLFASFELVDPRGPSVAGA